MIITLTLNPALDKTLVLNEFVPGQVNRVQSLRRDAGGKGLLVSKTIEALGGQSVALGIVGGATGQFIRDQLDALGIHHDLVEVNSETRTNLKLIDNLNHTYTEINEAGAPVHAMVIDEVVYALKSYVRKGDIVVLAGSLPEGCDKGLYAGIIQTVHELEAKAYLDCDGEALRLGVAARPDLIKPNKTELAQLCNIEKEDDIALFEEAKRLVKGGAGQVLLSLGAYGAIYMSPKFCLRAQGLKVPVVGRSGAGDAMMGALVLAEERGLDPHDRLRYAVAAASAKIMIAGTQPPEKDTVDELCARVVITDIS